MGHAAFTSPDCFNNSTVKEANKLGLDTQAALWFVFDPGAFGTEEKKQKSVTISVSLCNSSTPKERGVVTSAFFSSPSSSSIP
eukprot:scaffold53714_cov54-Attheya_sp.AAC.4